MISSEPERRTGEGIITYMQDIPPIGKYKKLETVPERIPES